jgi:hypothetical protein
MRVKLLPALSTGSAHGPAHRYVNVSSGISLYSTSKQIGRLNKKTTGCVPTLRIKLDG